MKKQLLIIFILIINSIHSQSYFEGDYLYCKSKNKEALKYYNAGIKLLHLNTNLNKKHLKKTADIFLTAYQKDTTFCDAMFFTGYTYRLLNDFKKTFSCYYIADSLSNNKSIEFKTNLAAVAISSGSDKGFILARKKYYEMINYFPRNPEGFYGIALTSIDTGDVEDGLKKIDLAINRYNGENKDALFLKAILLTLNARHEDSLIYYEKVKTAFRNNDEFKSNYALSLYEVAKMTNDEKMMKSAKKYYNKVKNKKVLSEILKKKFE